MPGAALSVGAIHESPAASAGGATIRDMGAPELRVHRRAASGLLIEQLASSEDPVLAYKSSLLTGLDPDSGYSTRPTPGSRVTPYPTAKHTGTATAATRGNFQAAASGTTRKASITPTSTRGCST